MNTISYKGFFGTVAFSEEDGVFFGKIEGINGLVNFEGESVKELTEAFHEAVDDYLSYCESEGIAPERSYTGVLNVRLSPAVHRRAALQARRSGVSLNAFIRDAVEQKVAHASM
ncbi:MAG: type II toxin-antitoxin system HicB family antitoxin [Bacteroidales bacterium]|nr:type II toxin-antitoxin system HicB family antitoxin [Bacteroidales bacterium]